MAVAPGQGGVLGEGGDSGVVVEDPPYGVILMGGYHAIPHANLKSTGGTKRLAITAYCGVDVVRYASEARN